MTAKELQKRNERAQQLKVLQAEVAEKYLHKGARIGIIGTLDQQRWETDEGIQRTSFQLIANTLEFIKTDGRGFSGEEGQDEDIPF